MKSWISWIPVVAALIAIQGSAAAGNKAIILQTGDGSAVIKQSGKNNTATVIQRIPNVPESRRNQPERGETRALIVQFGDANQAFQEQESAGNTAVVDQTGVLNSVTQKQAGDRNLAVAVQKGGDNIIHHTQKGAGQMHSVLQVGEGKTVAISQSGKP